MTHCKPAGASQTSPNVSRALFRGILVACMCGLPSVASATANYGDSIAKKFKTIYAAPPVSRVCNALTDQLNRPMLFDPNDRARSFLSADNVLLWSKQTVSNSWQFPETLGDIHDHSSLERLDVDLDGNGSTETILRRWYEVKGQKYNRVFLDSHPTSSSTLTPANTLIDETQLQTLVAGLGQPGIEIDSSYYLFEMLVEDKRIYVTALSTIFNGDQSSDRPAYIVEYSPQMTPSLVCVLSTVTH